MNSRSYFPRQALNRWRYAGLVWLVALSLAGCTLRVASPTKVGDDPAPTTQPLAEPLAARIPAGLSNTIRLPAGFQLEVFAQGLKEPRMLAIGPDGQLYAAERGAGRIVRLPDRDGDGQMDGLEVVASGLERPSSLAFYQDGSIYVGETTRVLRLTSPDTSGQFSERSVVIGDLPSGGHNTRTLLFSPDFSKLYVSIGSSCNVCDETDERRAAIMVYNPDGSGGEVYAHGLRNAVGLAWRPGSQELWATNNGRDMLGDDLPPETVYRVQQGGDHGWPHCHAGRIIDPDFGQAGSCEGVVAPAVEMQAHSAPLGLAFYTGTAFPKEYQGSLFVAFHGSWNRSEPTGYMLVRIPFAKGQPGAVQEFASGWLANGAAWGRPVDVITGRDGSLLVSDDAGGRIYRISYPGP